MKRCAIALALLGSGCGTQSDLWHGDDAFTSEERAAVEAGAAFTNEHVGGSLTIVWDGVQDSLSDKTIYRRAPPAALCVELRPDGQCGALTALHRMWIRPGLGNNDLVATAAHEFGHAVCLRHHHKPGLMSGDAFSALQWTPADQQDSDEHSCPHGTEDPSAVGN